MYLFFDIIKANRSSTGSTVPAVKHDIPLPEKHHNFLDVNQVDGPNKVSVYYLGTREIALEQ
jgi:hypothetical protein